MIPDYIKTNKCTRCTNRLKKESFEDKDFDEKLIISFVIIGLVMLVISFIAAIGRGLNVI